MDDNVMNRPLFRRREARDRLNEMAGVQGFNVGGGVFADPSGSIRRPLSPSSMIAPAQPVRPAGLPSALSFATGQENADLYTRAASGMVSSAQTDLELVRQRFAEERTPENYQRVLDAEEALRNAIQEAEALGTYVEETSAPPEPMGGMRELPSGPFVDTKDPSFGEGPEQVVSQMTPEQLDIFGRLDRAAERPVPEGSRAGMEAEARESRPPVSAAAPAARAGMEAEARESRPPGSIVANPTEVAAGLNAPDPVVRERTVQDFMREFSENAPKYEGGDRRLMHAMIGFAIAAGESPNAMTNIAQGLQAGAQMFLQDKAAKAEFDRQLQLNAMQYGLESAAKERERGRQPLQFVAMEDTTYKGRPVKAGTSVYIPYGEIERNGGVVPPGFGDNEMITAMVERQKAVDQSLADLVERQQIDDTAAFSERDKYQKAFEVATSAQRGLDYLGVAMLEIGDDRDITGFQGSWDSILNKFANLAGLERDEQFTSREDARTALQAALQPMIPAALSGTQTGNSISNFDVNLIIDAYLDEMMEGGVFSLAFVNEDRLLEKLKNAASTLESNRQSALTQMTAIETGLWNRTLRSGLPATSVVEPFRSQLPSQGSTQLPSAFGSLYYAGEGVYDIRMPEG